MPIPDEYEKPEYNLEYYKKLEKTRYGSKILLNQKLTLTEQINANFDIWTFTNSYDCR